MKLRQTLTWGIAAAVLAMSACASPGLSKTPTPTPRPSPTFSSQFASLPSAGQVLGRIKVGVGAGSTGNMAVGYGSVWIPNPGAGQLYRYDVTKQATGVLGAGGRLDSVSLAGGAVWIAPGGELEAWTPLGGGRYRVEKLIDMGATLASQQFSADLIWGASPTANRVIQVRHGGGKVVLRSIPAAQPTGVVIVHNSVYVTSTASNRVLVYDVNTATQGASINVGSRPTAITFFDGGLWIADDGGASIERVDVTTHSVTKTVPVGERPLGLTEAFGALWVVGPAGLVKVDPGTGAATAVSSGAAGNAIAAGSTELWVADANTGDLVRIKPV